MYRKPERAYREMDSHRPDEQKLQVVVDETDLWLTLPAAFPAQEAVAETINIVRSLRGDLKLWIALHPEFRISLTPVPVPKSAPPIVWAMAAAAAIMGVGPFAAVAGAVAQAVAKYLAGLLMARGLPREVIVENGGDIYICSEKSRVIALLSDPENPAQLGLRLDKADFPLAVCSSSALIGPSLSFGQSDLAMVRARDGALADAAATAYGNMLKDSSCIAETLRRAEGDAPKGIEGVFVQCGGQVGIWGRLELVAVNYGC